MAIAPAITSPVEPSIESVSLWVNVLPPTLILRPFSSIVISPAPATQQRPQPRATTAAWLVMPPVLVRMPTAECMPSMSSGLVSLRTSSTCSPASVRSTASAAVNASLPTAAPGEAGRPSVSSRPSFFACAWPAARSWGAKLRQVAGRNAENGRLFVDQLLLDHVAGDLHGRRAGPFAVARLQHEQRAASIVNSMSCTSR